MDLVISSHIVIKSNGHESSSEALKSTSFFRPWASLASLFALVLLQAPQGPPTGWPRPPPERTPPPRWITGMNKLLSGFRGLLGPMFQGRYSQVSLSVNSTWASRSLFRHLASGTIDADHVVMNKSTGAPSKQADDEGSRQSGSAGKPVRGGPVSWLSLLLLILTGGGLIIYYDKEKKRHIEELKAASATPKEGPSVGTAAIGGPFKLVNHDGKSVTEKDFLGKWTLIYFGFTHCPDICPDELMKLTASVDKIKATAGIEIVPVFISVDPERDTVEQIHDYVIEFHPNLIGLTGTPEAIRQVARAYRVYYMKTEEEGSDYLVDHSIVMYLMNPKMGFTKFFGKNYDVDALAEGIIKEVKQYKNLGRQNI